ncbi:MAG: deoxyribodipyrimidine photo-lyase, partial [Lentisphaeraceae bacterium]|nr:deoxyribodipyrimidine photo-lyase [Lentisphaeraceae bacterium]
MKVETNLVWFKKDMRVKDNKALAEASKRGEVLCIYIDEPDFWALESISRRHRNFTAECLRDLQDELKELGTKLLVLNGSVIEVFEYLRTQFDYRSIFSHEETGNSWTFERDRRVRSWCKDRNIELNEFQNNGIVRRLSNRDGWASLWNVTMTQVQSELPENTRFANVNHLDSVEFHSYSEPQIQNGGRTEGLKTLDSFINERGNAYRGGISSPVTAVTACSRLSPYFSNGSLSIKEVSQKVDERIAELKLLPVSERKGWLSSLRDFKSRLYWHCHFIQKLEIMPSLEFKNIHSCYDGLRESSFNENYYDAWKGGFTGFPFIDACMRYLNKYGWINFRMRAMLVSFATNNLWLHWKPVADHLGRQFTDYEPGIHYSQIQMQAGTTG